MNNKNIPLSVIILIILLFWALSGSFLGALFFIIYLIHFINNFKKEIQPWFAKLRQDKKHMQETIYNGEPIISKLTRSAKNGVIIIVILVIAVLLLAASIVIVDAGFTGVYSLFGKVKDRELASGLHLVNPFAKIIPMSIRTEEYTMSIAVGEGKKIGADAISALTKEGLNVDLDITVLYRLNQDDASSVYKDVGLNYEEKIIRPAIRSSIREVIAQYEAKDIYSEKRQEAAQKILENLIAKLEPRGIVMEDILLRNVKLPRDLENAIQEKLRAEQEAEKYDFLLDKEKKEKERKVIEAEGQRDAQKIINQSLSTNYLYYLYINELKDREGTVYVPTSPSTGMPLFRDLGR